MKKLCAVIIVRPWLGKAPTVCLSEIEAPTVSMAGFWETNQRWKRQALLPKTSIHSPVHAAIALPIFPMNRRQWSNPAIAVCGLERVASTPCGCGVSALGGRPRSTPVSSCQRNRGPVDASFPHGNDKLRRRLRSVQRFEAVVGMNRMANVMGQKPCGKRKPDCFIRFNPHSRHHIRPAVRSRFHVKKEKSLFIERFANLERI
jgi:hypothetical protein